MNHHLEADFYPVDSDKENRNKTKTVNDSAFKTINDKNDTSEMK